MSPTQIRLPRWTVLPALFLVLSVASPMLATPAQAAEPRSGGAVGTTTTRGDHDNRQILVQYPGGNFGGHHSFRFQGPITVTLVGQEVMGIVSRSSSDGLRSITSS